MNVSKYLNTLEVDGLLRLHEQFHNNGSAETDALDHAAKALDISPAEVLQIRDLVDQIKTAGQTHGTRRFAELHEVVSPDHGGMKAGTTSGHRARLAAELHKS